MATSLRLAEAGPGVAAKAEPILRLSGVTKRFGTFTAVDAATGKIRWQHKVNVPLMTGGALATAGGLVFLGEPAHLTALDAESGRVVWRYDLDKGVVGPPITFMIDGKQRVAVTSTRGVTVFGLHGD